MTCTLCGASISDERGVCPSCGLRPASFALSRNRTESPPTGPAQTVPARATVVTFLPGQSFGDRYTVVEEVGAGGMGQVYKAIDRKLGKTVALKLIRPEAAAHHGALERFRRELTLAQEVTHPNVCRVHDLGEVGGAVYISMEYVVGQTLEDLVQSVGHLSPRQTVVLARQICAGLQAIHERAIVHRDLKPGNVMVDRSGHALVMDFGLAYQTGDSRLTDAGAVLGTLAYLSPELARGQASDLRSDIYSLGLILYEMLSGRRPPGDTAPLPLALRDATEPCPPPSRFMAEVPPALDAVVMKCLNRDPARRFSSALELDQALAVVAGLTSDVSSSLRPLSGRPARPWGVGLALALAVAVLVVGALRLPAFWPRPQPSAPPMELALLPFAYEGAPEKSYLKEVLPLVLSEALKASSGLRVVPFASARTFAPDEEPRAVARQLAAHWVVQGKLSVTGDRFRATLRGSRGQDGLQAWSKSIEGEISALLPEADRVAGEVATLMGASVVQARAGATRNPLALEHYFEGRRFLEGWDIERNYAKAETAFEKALQIDPRFAEAHAMLATTLCIHYGESKEPALVQRAMTEAETALSLSSHLPEAHAALGSVELARGRSVEAARAFERGLELAPADDSLCRRIGKAYADLGRDDDAEKMYQRAIDLRPSYWYNHNWKGIFYLRRGRLEEAKEVFRQVIALRPESDAGYTNLAAAHIMAGEHAEARPLLEAALRINPSHQTRNNLGVVYYATGQFQEAAREWKAAADGGVQSAMLLANLGDAYRQMGDSALARAAYARATELGKAQVKVNPADTESRAMLSVALAGAGRCGDARREAGQAAAGARVEPAVAYYTAIAYAVCGDRDAALRQTARAIQGGVVADVKTNPDLKGLLGQPEIRKLIR